MKHLAGILMVALGAGGQLAAAQGVSPDVQKQLEQAQERLNQSAREVADLSLKLYGPGSPAMPPLPPLPPGHGRPALGVNIGSDPESGGDGVKILSVSPGGPADKAGLRANDVIVAFDGKPLKAEGRQSAHQLLIRELREAKPDTAVVLDYRRDGKDQRVSVTPKNMVSFMDEPFLEGLKAIDVDGGNLNVFIGSHASHGFGSAEFLNLTPGLGRYFGTGSGLLVVRAPKDDRLKLEEGDVVLDIDGRVPSSASHAFRIFSSYRGGETMKLHIMRQQKKLEVPVQVPADGAKLDAFQPGDFDGFGVSTPGRGASDD